LELEPDIVGVGVEIMKNTIVNNYKKLQKCNGPEFSPIDMLSTQTAGKRNQNKRCVFVEEKTHTQKYKKRFQKKYHRHHQPEGYQECNVKAAANSGKVQWLLVNQQTRPGVSLKHFLYHKSDSNRINKACTLLHSNT
jgi:hypothetical protein